MIDTIKHEQDCDMYGLPGQAVGLLRCTCGASTTEPPQPGEVLPEEINRYDLIQTAFRDPDPCPYVGLHPSGKYVLYEDHLTAQAEAFKECTAAFQMLLAEDSHKAEALAAKDADLNECKYDLVSLRDTLDNLVTTVRERAESAEARVKVLEGALRPLMAFLRDRVTDAPRAGYIQIVCTEDENDLISGILAALLSDAEAALRGEEG